MSLKQAMRISVLLLALGAVAMAGTVQLMDVAVQSHDNATTLTIKASGTFTHTAYRPADNLLLVDLSGVTADKLENQTRSLRLPGVESYHVVSYKGANGTITARLEISLSPGTVVQIDPATNAVMVKLTGKAASSAEGSITSITAPEVSEKNTAHTMAMAEKTAERPAMAPHSSKSSTPAQISSVTVSRSKDGLNVDIKANSAITPTAFKLTGPDRIVIDVPNSLPLEHQKTIAVNSNGVADIRIARYALKPPATRIVVDLDSAKEFSLDANGSRASLHLGTVLAATVATSNVKTAPIQAPNVTAVSEQSASVTAKPKDATSTMAELKFVTKPASPEVAAEYKSTLANGAASHSVSTAAQDQLPVTKPNAIMSYQPAVNLAAMQQAATASVATNNPLTSKSTACGTSSSGEPISVNFKDVDIKDFFRLISDISGLNVVLDPKVNGTIPALVLTDVPWDQAMGIVLQNNSLDCSLSGNVLRIASAGTLKVEADARKAAQDAQAQASETQTVTRYISYATAADMIATIKSFLTPRGTIVADTRTNSLIITDIPTSLPRVDQMIKQLDQKTQEVEIEVRVVTADRSFSRDLGVQLGFQLLNASTTVNGGGTPTGVGTVIKPTVTPATSIPPLFFNGVGSGLSFLNQGKNYNLDAILSMAESRKLVKVLSRPRVITQNNKAATVRQGSQIPVTTPPTPNSPAVTTYIPALLRLTVTPQITAEGTIFLNVDIDDSSVGDINPVTGNFSINTSSATTSVLVTDGSTVVLGGVVKTTTTVSYAQVPVLGNIPILGNLFKSRKVLTDTAELVFFITPRIIQI